MTNKENMALTELNGANGALQRSIRVEQALAEIKDTFQAPMLAKIPFAEIATLGGSFSGVVETLATPAAEGIYRCVFPKGVSGSLAMAKDGSGALGAIMNESGIAGQARWLPVDKAIGPACLRATLVAVAVLAVVKQISDIKDGQKEIVSILERDKKSQLLADYDILASYMDDYKYYWENEADTVVNLNQVKNIKRNAQKDIRSYTQRLEELVAEKTNLLKMQTASQSIGKILNCFVHYKLALHVFALSEYMEVMLSKNFQAEFLNKISADLRDCSIRFRELYTNCYDKIEKLKKEALTTQAANKFAKATSDLGRLIGKIPVVEKGSIDEFLISIGASIDETEKKQLEKTMNFFIQYKESGIIPVAEHIDTINTLSNKPVIMLYNKDVLCFEEIEEAV
ncbi:hypothetical protein [Oscillibacter sp.]|uniref:hypothetical protein n=1 Tax=Oscillibacter sp. TaxID=1945593 RepID=UPI003391453D